MTSFQDILRVYQSLQDDQALERDDAIIIIDLVIKAIDGIRPAVKKVWLQIALAGMQKILLETQEHLQELE